MAPMSDRMRRAQVYFRTNTITTVQYNLDPVQDGSVHAYLQTIIVVEIDQFNTGFF